MKPLFKYSGGKSREFSFISKHLPLEFDRIIEPFAGSGAVSFLLEKPAILSDLRENNIKTFIGVRDHYDEIRKYFDTLSVKTIEELEKEYYLQRDTNFGVSEPVDVAKRWIVLRQLCFSGMDRINGKTGKFNVPFGWYPNFKSNLSKKHSHYLKTCELIHGDWKLAYEKATENDFIFLDPPYYNRNSEYGGDYVDSENLHIEIADWFSKMPGKAMMVHIDCPLYRDLYKNHTIIEKPFKYSQNFKGRESKGSKVNHLYIVNYIPKSSIDPLF